MNRSIVGVALALSLFLAPLAHANSAYVPIGDPYTDTIGLWSDIASALSSLANDFASLFNGQEFAVAPPATPPAALAAAAADAAPAQPPTQRDITYTVLAGDTLSGIAKTFSVSLSNILAANDLSQGAILHPGETLIVPDPQTAPATSSETAPNATSDQATLSQNVKSAEFSSAQSSTPNSTNVIEAGPAFNVSDFVTQSELAQVLLALSTSLSTKSAPTAAPAVPLADGNPLIPYAAENNITNLSNVTITNANLSASEIPALDYLPLSGGTLTGTLSVPTLDASSTNYGVITATNASSTNLSNFDTAYFGGTGTTTIDSAGDLSVAGNTSLVNATSSNLSVSGAASTSNLVVSNSFTLGTLTGILHAAGGVISASLINLTSDVTGILPLADGGTGQNSFGQGWIISNGTTLSASTSPTVNYLTATSTTNNSSFAAGVTIGAATSTSLTITGGSSAVTLQANSGSAGGIDINSRNGNQIVFNNQVNSPYFRTPNNTATLSGTSVPTSLGNFSQNLAGSSTNSGSTWGASVNIGNSSDNASINSGGWDELLIAGNFGGSAFTGARGGMDVYLNLNSTSTLNAQGNGLVGYGSKVIASVNAGGSASGYGTTQFGLGSLFGANPWCDLSTGATYYTQCVGEEIDGAIEAGASASSFALQQLVLTSDHAVHGTNNDAMQSFTAQSGASAGVRNVIEIGSYGAQWPVDSNGYLLQAQSGQSNVSNPANAAGGIDLEQANFTGTGVTGGGFSFRSQGFSIDSNGGTQIGYGYVSSASTGFSIDTTEYTLSGTPTISSGGSNYNSNALAADAYGNIVRVTASGGAVTSITVMKRGWSNTPPPNPVTFTALTPSSGVYGSGLALNESWSTTHTLMLNPTSGGSVVLGTSTPSARLSVWSTDSASSTLAFNVVNSASTTLFSVFDGGNAELSGSLSQSSDERLKTNIQSLDASSSLSLIQELNPVTFNWIDPNKGSTPQLGFIAQQVLQIFPNLVSTTSATALTPGGTLSLNYIGLISPIVSAIQAISAEISSIENTVAGFAQSITTDLLTATTVQTQQLCVGSTCVTPAQFQAIVAAASASQSSGQGSGGASADDAEATDTPPVIQVNGDNPAVIQVGATYNDLGATITGPTADLNLGIQTVVNGTEMSPVQLDTSQAATDTIDYVATDQNGLSSTTTRTVIIEAPSIDPSDDASSTSTTSEDSAATTSAATSTSS